MFLSHDHLLHTMVAATKTKSWYEFSKSSNSQLEVRWLWSSTACAALLATVRRYLKSRKLGAVPAHLPQQTHQSVLASREHVDRFKLSGATVIDIHVKVNNGLLSKERNTVTKTNIGKYQSDLRYLYKILVFLKPELPNTVYFSPLGWDGPFTHFF